MSPTAIRLVTLILAGVAYAASSYLTGSGHDGLIAVAAALLGWTVPMPAAVGRKSLPPVALVFAVLLAGCASAPAQSRKVVNATRVVVNNMEAAVAVLCQVTPAKCDDARSAYEAASVAVEAAQDAVEVWNLAQTAKSAADAGAAIDEAFAAKRRLERAVASN